MITTRIGRLDYFRECDLKKGCEREWDEFRCGNAIARNLQSTGNHPIADMGIMLASIGHDLDIVCSVRRSFVTQTGLLKLTMNHAGEPIRQQEQGQHCLKAAHAITDTRSQSKEQSPFVPCGAIKEWLAHSFRGSECREARLLCG